MSEGLLQLGLGIAAVAGSLFWLRRTTWHLPAERAGELVAEHRFSLEAGEPVPARPPGYREPANAASPRPLRFDAKRARPRNMRLTRTDSSIAIWLDVDRREQFVRVDALREGDQAVLRAFALRRPPSSVPVDELEAIVRPILSDLATELAKRSP